MTFYIGTSGFQYKHWNDGIFYPSGTQDQLGFIYRYLNCVEINSSHYRIPNPETVQRWAQKIPNGSKMVLKCPRSVSHRRRLLLESDSQEVRPGVDYLDYFATSYMEISEEKRGPVLLQINDKQVINPRRLEDVLRFLKYFGLRCAFEARHPSWFISDIFRLLERYEAALVSHDWEKYKCPLVVTSDFVYLRKHGPKKMYTGSYSMAELAAMIKEVDKLNVDAYVMFNNDGEGFAPKNASLMMEMVRER